MHEDIMRRLEEIYPEMVRIRREFHQFPELSFQEVETPRKIAAYLTDWGIDVRSSVGGRGVVGLIKGGHPGKTVALRADFDALPIQDEKDTPYRSKVDGIMHACGHDAHTAIVLAVAKALSENKQHLHGNVVLIHQFGEEVAPGGAKPMIEDGCLEGVDAVFGTHVWSGVPSGDILYRSGPLMAGGGVFDIEITGSGGHGSYPQDTIDPIMIGTAVVQQLQQIISLRKNPLNPAVLTVTTFHAGQGYDVIPHTATITGSVRTFDDGLLDQIIEQMNRVIGGVTQSAGGTYTFEFTKGYPAVVNHPEETELLVNSALKVAAPSQVKEMDPVMAGEDFAYYLKEVPGCFFFTGSGTDTINYPNHHPKFDIDEQSMLQAAKVLATVTLDYLANN
ncbi:MAG: M20 family metallopeptidase [Bacillus sp. (in: firmicutes)]